MSRVMLLMCSASAKLNLAASPWGEGMSLTRRGDGCKSLLFAVPAYGVGDGGMHVG